MNPTLKIPNKISAMHHGHVRRGPYILVLYKTRYVLRALVACHVVAKKCSHTKDVLARASSLPVTKTGGTPCLLHFAVYLLLCYSASSFGCC